MFGGLPAIFHVERSFELLEHEEGVLDFRSSPLDVADPRMQQWLAPDRGPEGRKE